MLTTVIPDNGLKLYRPGTPQRTALQTDGQTTL